MVAVEQEVVLVVLVLLALEKILVFLGHLQLFSVVTMAQRLHVPLVVFWVLLVTLLSVVI